MPEVTVKIIEGRTIDQKRGLVKDITAALVNNAGSKSEHVVIDIIEYKAENKAKDGKLSVDR